jgi:16S rRNA (adenine1518-N6/adenine1519-N6)-dimethyltransferase
VHGQSSSARAQLRALGRRPRKRLSQAFLESNDVADAIVAAAELEPDDEVLEVGPGLGVLTSRLARAARRVVAIEVDPELAKALGGERVEVVVADILRVDPSQYFERDYLVVANLPYHITSPVLRHLLSGTPKRLVVMVQAEVAERIAAKPGDLSALAVSVQVLANVEVVLDVPRSAFFPAPKVDSAVLRLEPLQVSIVPHEEMEAFVRIVHAGFAQPRKTLRNSLAQGLGISSAEAATLLSRSGIDPVARAQAISLEDWLQLYRSTH